ncbi:hypothetical protein J2T56_002776 [Natronobacillus azotifigens]|uniref:Uncharacterized protein n=1 Tax=Natronobacillus azotifigens TaxID=472978 RepID=A0A9J6RFS0_9BACI|nr:hypothetical protein [Natronobacillus azotifigens]MCZ0704407.1 hypothetical protein [Natronobacillus azotifigens]
MDYITSNNLDEGLDFNFVESADPHLHLHPDNVDSVSTLCIACVGYYNAGTTRTTEWVNLVPVHAIKGVDVMLTVSSSSTTASNYQTRTAYKSGAAEVSGSSSISYGSKTTYPVRTGTTVSSNGVWARTQVEFLNTLWKHHNGNQYRTKRAHQWIGGTNWGASIRGGNGVSFNSVSGSIYLPGSTHTREHISTRTNTTGVSLTAFGTTQFISHTIGSTRSITWDYTFKRGHGFKEYKLYNTPTINNLTAR